MSKLLKEAIEANDPEAVGKALKGVKDVNRKLPGTNTPLLYACEKGSDQVLEKLFEAGAIAEKRNTFPGDTPFSVAATHGRIAVLRKLLAMKKASEKTVKFVLQKACLDGNAAALELVLQETKPPITIEIFRVAAAAKNDAVAVVKLLLKNGGDTNLRFEDKGAMAVTPLHEFVTNGKPELIRVLVDAGANVNARDSLGRTPLMLWAAEFEGVSRNEIPKYEAVLKTLLELGADGSLLDKEGNDATDYCLFAFMQSGVEAPPKIVGMLRNAKAKGSVSTVELLKAIRKDDLGGVRAAIAKGADVNRITPAPVRFSMLEAAAGSRADNAVEMVRALLKAGADPNKSSCGGNALIPAARSGNLAVVKELVAAGADIHAVHRSGDYMENAYSASEQHEEVRNYLKSAGAGNPRYENAELLKPGVASWNDFSELLVKGTVEAVAKGLGKMIGGKPQLNVYGQTVSPGKEAFVVIRPVGMEWANVFRVAPPRRRFEDIKKTVAFATEVAKACGAPVLSIEYSDTSDAASVTRVEADGKKREDKGWDRETLQEMVDAMGDEAPAWAKKQLTKTKEGALSSTERVVALAEQEKFVVAAFGFYAEPGKKMDVEVTGYGAEAFDGVAWVSN